MQCFFVPFLETSCNFRAERIKISHFWTSSAQAPGPAAKAPGKGQAPSAWRRFLRSPEPCWASGRHTLEGPLLRQVRCGARSDPTRLNDVFTRAKTGVGWCWSACDSTAGSLFLKPVSAWFLWTSPKGPDVCFAQMSSGGAGVTSGVISGFLKWVWLFELGEKPVRWSPQISPIKADLFFNLQQRYLGS